MELWTIYSKPNDFPEHYVARRLLINAHGAVFVAASALVSAELEHLRAELARLRPGLHRVERQADDDPVIVEVWL